MIPPCGAGDVSAVQAVVAGGASPFGALVVRHKPMEVAEVAMARYTTAGFDAHCDKTTRRPWGLAVGTPTSAAGIRKFAGPPGPVRLEMAGPPRRLCAAHRMCLAGSAEALS